VALIEVDIVDTQPLERGVDLLQDLWARQASILVAHREKNLRRQNVAVAWPLREHFAEKAFRGTAP